MFLRMLRRLSTSLLISVFLAGAVSLSAQLTIGQSYDGVDFLGSTCSCLPPDTNAAVGNNFVVETVNLKVRVFNKTTGAILLDEPLSTLFGGAPTNGDEYVVYDDNANRWYVSALDGPITGLLLAVSLDGNPLDGFTTYHLALLGFTDYPKLGFNKDAIFISFNNFGGAAAGAATIAAIDKAAALSGTLTYYVSTPKFQYKAMPPAQMHPNTNGNMNGDTNGGVEWFVSTDGTDTGGDTIRVTKMTHYLSNSPQFAYTSLSVTPYVKVTGNVDQPAGLGTITTMPNTTTTQVHYRNGHLVTAMSSGTAADGFLYPKGLYYLINVANGVNLMKQGVINPGAGVAVQIPSVAEDKYGNLGFTWMESSSTEDLSMWIGTLTTNGSFSSQVAAPGGGFFTYDFRIGDYSTVVVDPSDGVTFWGANEYIGGNGTVDIWLTHITSFKSPISPPGQNQQGQNQNP